MGNALRAAGRRDEAVEAYERALALQPDHAHAHNNLGNAMKDRGLVEDAVKRYREAIRLRPTFAAAHSNLGLVLKERGDVRGATRCYEAAIAVDPTFADAYSNLGTSHKDLGRLEEAVRYYAKAIELRPTFAEAYSNLAGAYKDSGRHAEAVACYREALALRPDFGSAFADLAHSLVFVCDWTTREHDFRNLWSTAEASMKSKAAPYPAGDDTKELPNGHRRLGDTVYPPDCNLAPALQPFHTLVYPVPLENMKDVAEAYARKAARGASLMDLPAPVYEKFTPIAAASSMSTPLVGEELSKPPDGRTRIGYVSSDFGNHPLAHLTQSMFGMHDRSKFHAICYSLSPSDASPWREKIAKEVETFIDASRLSARDCALRIRADSVDVLVNLNGYTKGAKNEIFALRPAPIQIGYMGFCGTLGAAYVPYLVADATVVPTEHAVHYSEKIIRLPHSLIAPRGQPGFFKRAPDSPAREPGFRAAPELPSHKVLRERPRAVGALRPRRRRPAPADARDVPGGPRRNRIHVVPTPKSYPVSAERATSSPRGLCCGYMPARALPGTACRTRRSSSATLTSSTRSTRASWIAGAASYDGCPAQSCGSSGSRRRAKPTSGARPSGEASRGTGSTSRRCRGKTSTSGGARSRTCSSTRRGSASKSKEIRRRGSDVDRSWADTTRAADDPRFCGRRNGSAFLRPPRTNPRRRGRRGWIRASSRPPRTTRDPARGESRPSLARRRLT